MSCIRLRLRGLMRNSLAEWIVYTVMGFGLLGAADARAGDQLEQRVKAAFIYKFVQYVEWPAAALPPDRPAIVIGEIGSEHLSNELSRITSDVKPNNRTVVVKRLNPGDPLTGIHVLFVAESEENQLSELLRRVKSKPVLVVTETDGALDIGSMINFVLVDQRVRFDISLASAEKSGIKLSSRLLNVARHVDAGKP